MRVSSLMGTTGRRLLSLVGVLAVAAGVLFGAVGPTEAAGGVMFKPDLRVTYVGRQQSGMDVIFTFRISNIGAADAYQVDVNSGFTRIWLFPSGAPSVGTQQPGGGSVSKIAMDQSVTRQVVCHGGPGWYCAGASLSAHVADDLDTSNNKASSK